MSDLIKLYYSDAVYYISMGFIYPLGFIFLFILLKSDQKYKWQAGIIVCYCILTIMMPELNEESFGYKGLWIGQAYISLMINGAAMVAMLATSFFGRLNILQSNVLLFGVIIQYMVASRLEVKPEDVTIYMELFYYLYDELIILTYCLLILVAYNGIRTAYTNTLSSVQRRIYGDDVYYNSFVGGVFRPEEARKRK